MLDVMMRGVGMAAVAALFIAAGAIANAAVCYAIVVLERGQSRAVTPPTWPVPVPPGTPEPTWAARFATIWSSRSYAGWAESMERAMTTAGGVILMTGPPLQAVNARLGVPFRSVALTQAPPAAAQTLHVLWLGTIANALIYGAALRAVVVAPGALRRRWRIGHRLCPRCAYPFGQSALCTECGQPLGSSRVG